MKTVASLLLSLTTLVLTAQTKAYTLEECVLMALDKNISIKQSELDIENAEIDKADAIGSFLPRVNAQSQHIWNNGLSQNITNGLIENLTTQFSSFGGNIGVTLFNGKQNINQLSRANLNLIARQYQLDDMKDDISLFVANAYLQVMFNRELAQVQRFQLEITKEDLERTKVRIQAGVLTQADIYFQLKDMSKYGELMEEAISVDPNNPQLFFNLGVISFNQGKVEEARKNYEKAIESYEKAKELYPSMRSPDIMIKQIKDLIKKSYFCLHIINF